MEPIAIVTAILAALYIVGRGPLVVAPAATVAFYRRRFSNAGHVRAFGCLLVLLAVPLIVTARQARAEFGDITIFVEGMGWLTTVAAAWCIIAPGNVQRLKMGFWDSVTLDSARRAFGALNVVFGLYLAWVAFVVF